VTPGNKLSFVVVSEVETHTRWLAAALGAEASLVLADDPSVDRVLQLCDAASADMVFLRFGGFDFTARARLVERLLERKPNLTVIALGESDDKEVVLAAVRAGARDFVAVGAPAGELRELVDRCSARRTPAGPQRAGRIHTLLSARPDMATATLAVHLALALQHQLAAGEQVLLLDLGVPVGDSLLFLNLRPSFCFSDAVRSVRRFDQALVRTAFAQHESGLSLLPLPEDPAELESVEPADATALVGVLCSHFAHVVVNLAGFYDLRRLSAVVARSERVLLHADQCVASCRAARRLLDLFAREKLELPALSLVIDRYQPRLHPNAAEVAEALDGLPFVTLPAYGMQMVEAMNRGQSLFEIASRTPYARGVRALAAAILGQSPEREPPLHAWDLWARLWRGR
jgi:pilus assembly protein CpaE